MPKPEISQRTLAGLQVAAKDARLKRAKAETLAAEVRRALEAGQKVEAGLAIVELRQEECGGCRVSRLYLDGAPLEF